jgi:type I restriction enzyme R subunit
MPSNKEKQFESHIVGYLSDPARHGMTTFRADQLTDRKYHFVASELFAFLRDTQPETLRNLEADYGADTEGEVLRHLQEVVRNQPLWLLIRNGLEVRHQKFQLYYPKPRNQTSPTQTAQYQKNRFGLKSQYHFDAASPDLSIDIVLWLNGLPIVTLELKHPDEGQTVSDAIQQYADRDHNNRIFELPFWHIAADTQDVKAATRPVPRYFQWLNAGLENKPSTPEEYPVEHLYRDLLAPDTLLAFLESYLIYVPSVRKMDSGGLTVIEPDETLFPRYHQLRSARTVAQNVSEPVRAKR